jgi:hypothetical protein
MRRTIPRVFLLGMAAILGGLLSGCPRAVDTALETVTAVAAITPGETIAIKNVNRGVNRSAETNRPV